MIISQEAFASAVVRGNWNCRVELSNGEAVVIHSPTAMVHYSSQYFQPLNHEVVTLLCLFFEYLLIGGLLPT